LGFKSPAAKSGLQVKGEAAEPIVTPRRSAVNFFPIGARLIVEPGAEQLDEAKQSTSIAKVNQEFAFGRVGDKEAA